MTAVTSKVVRENVSKLSYCTYTTWQSATVEEAQAKAQKHMSYQCTNRIYKAPSNFIVATYVYMHSEVYWFDNDCGMWRWRQFAKKMGTQFPDHLPPGEPFLGSGVTMGLHTLKIPTTNHRMLFRSSRSLTQCFFLPLAQYCWLTVSGWAASTTSTSTGPTPPAISVDCFCCDIFQ